MDYKWRKSYEVGIDIVDKQHKQLFSMIVKMLEMPIHERPKHTKDLVKELYNYSEEHFRTEENLMKKFDYPQEIIDAHHKEHVGMIGEIEQLTMHHYSDGFIFGNALLDFLKDWVINHLLGDDQDFADWARENKKL